MDQILYTKILDARLCYSVLIPTIGGQPGAYWSHGLANIQNRLGAFQEVGRRSKELFSQHISQTHLEPSEYIECVLSQHGVRQSRS